MYKLYIDDLRSPKDTTMIVVRSSIDAIDYVKENGIPNYISFDHDLGYNDTSMNFVHWFVDYLLDNRQLKLPDDFDFNVHSANPVGSDNIKGLMNSLIKFLNE
jgi:hypothetical protein